MTVTASPLDDTSYNPSNATTATKTDTPIMETPVNTQVVPQQVLRDQQAIQFNKALDNVSGVYRVPSGVGHDFSSLRGFTTFDYYRDGVRQLPADFQTGVRALANIERVEVLKGLVAILYGRIEPGGLINLVTKQPLASPYYFLQQQFGSFDLYRKTMEATGPFTKVDSLHYRLDLSYENGGSFREFLENEQLFLAPVLQWNLSERSTK